MTVENTSNRKSFEGDNVTTEIPFNFRVLSADDLLIYVYPEDLDFTDINDYLLSPSTDYSVTLEEDGEGGFVTLTTAATTMELGLILNQLALTQTADLPTEGNFNEVAVETALDRMVMQNIQQQEQINRNLSLRPEDPLAADPAFPGFYIAAQQAVDRAGRLMRFNDDGDGVSSSLLVVDLEALENITADITTVAGIAADVTTVADNIADVVTVSSSMTAVNSVAANMVAILDVYADLTAITGVYAELADINAVAADLSNINAVAADLSNIDTVFANLTPINTVATNIADIQNAEENANIAKAAAGFTYTYSTTTTAADPGSGFFRLNNATVASATAMYISETTGLAQAIAAEIATWDDSTSTIHGKLRIFKQSDPSVFVIFNVTGTITDNGSWDTLTVAYVTGSGAIANNDVLTIQYLRTGDKGDTGSPGTVPYSAGAGTVDAITANFTPDIALTDGQICIVTSTGPNTVNNPTFTPDGLTTRTIVAQGGGVLAVGDTGAAGYPLLLAYNLANTRWELMNPAKVIEGDILLADNTTNDASTARHGFLKKLSNVATEFINGQGNWAVPAGAAPSSLGSTATTSGADVPVTGIPSTAYQVDIHFTGVSLSATTSPLLQIGDSGGVENTGYLSICSTFVGGGVATQTSTTGFHLSGGGWNSTDLVSGLITLTKMSGNTWSISGQLYGVGASYLLIPAGVKTLSAALDRVNLNTPSGSFDAGSITVNYRT